MPAARGDDNDLETELAERPGGRGGAGFRLTGFHGPVGDEDFLQPVIADVVMTAQVVMGPVAPVQIHPGCPAQGSIKGLAQIGEHII